ncbi:MAG TPA: AI-2E family transporter [Silvibacterium sp.]|nr:AI-2E family transporter [Silvibacterium sp.]
MPPDLRSQTLRSQTLRSHARTAGTALLNWWRAVSLEALCVAILWWIGLTLLHVPLAPVWALIGGLMTFVPNFGGVITVIFPVMAITLSGHDFDRLAFVLGLYAVIVIIDQLVLQPWLLKRTSRVPIWASIFVPIFLGIIIPFWGVLLGPPLLAIVYAFRRPKAKFPPQAPPPQAAWPAPPGQTLPPQRLPATPEILPPEPPHDPPQDPPRNPPA